MLAIGFPAKIDHHGIRFFQAVSTLAVSDHIEHRWLDTFLERNVLVHRPLHLAVHLTCYRQDCNFTGPRAAAGLRTQMFGKGAKMRERLSSIELDAGRALQARDRSARSHGFIIGLLADIIQIVAIEQRQPKSGLWIDVRFHRLLNFDR
jgi:hypothetical protein